MPTSGRLVLCNMTVEAGATSGIVPGDAETLRYLREEAGVQRPLCLVLPDPDAVYERTIGRRRRRARAPGRLPARRRQREAGRRGLGRQACSQIVIGSCTNGRLDDIETAARIVRAGRWPSGTRLLVFPASAASSREARRAGATSPT